MGAETGTGAETRGAGPLGAGVVAAEGAAKASACCHHTFTPISASMALCRPLSCGRAAEGAPEGSVVAVGAVGSVETAAERAVFMQPLG
jgi:hypothetical protein